MVVPLTAAFPGLYVVVLLLFFLVGVIGLALSRSAAKNSIDPIPLRGTAYFER